MSPQFVAVAGLAALLPLMGAGSLLALRAQARQDRLRARIARTTQPYRRLAVRSETGPGVALADVSKGLGRLLARGFGFDPAMREHYAMRWWMALLATLAVATAASWLAAGVLGPSLLAGLPLIWVFLSRACFGWLLGRWRGRLFVQFPDALAMIVRAVRVGIPVSDCIRAVGRELPPPTGPEFSRLADELSIGVALEDALKAMSRRNGLSEYYFFATTLSLQNQTGGGLSETLENLADVIRKRVAVRERGRALAAEAQASAIVLSLLPPLAGGALWLLDPEYIMLLFTDPTGKKILALAVGGLACGTLMMRHMIRKSLS